MPRTQALQVLDNPAERPAAAQAVVALIGNPNAGKTTIFNQLTGLRAQTANFPGTTIERRIGTFRLGNRHVRLIDLPGLYGLSAASAEEKIARDVLLGDVAGRNGQDNQAGPSAAIVIVDATNLERNLYLASQVIELGVRCVVALNMIDLARRMNLRIDTEALSRELGAPVVPVCGRSGEGIAALKAQLATAIADQAVPVVPEGIRACGVCTGCVHGGRFDWAEQVSQRCAIADAAGGHGRTERIDRVLTHPVVGVAAFFTVMAGVFLTIFWLAAYPMDWIDALFASAQVQTARILPEGDLRNLLVEGVIGGVGGLLVFLPQICILFFFLALLEDTGYLARAAFVMDRLMRRVGLPGKAFVPMLSAHACAIPAIMSTRVIEDRRDRLVTILVLPLMTCSARIPVYAMVTALLFPNQPLRASLLFTGAYALGIAAAIGVAFAFKRTILPGEPRPLVLELPSYKVPRLRNALLTMYERAMVFVKNAGTIILVISVVLWVLATYPKSDPPAEALAMQQQAAALEAAGDGDAAAELLAAAGTLESRHALANSIAGRMGRFIEPVIRPLGFDWQIGVGVISSLAAREVIVSTLAIVYGVGADVAEEEPQSLYDSLRASTRADGSPVFTTATCVSLLVFYVLAMQCLPTQAVTKRETNSWRWPIFQFAYMTVLAYTAALIAYQIVLHLPGGTSGMSG
jgi:ferrous iron transport protein B